MQVVVRQLVGNDLVVPNVDWAVQPRLENMGKRRAGVYLSRAGACAWQPKPRMVAEAARAMRRAWRPKPPQLYALRSRGSRVLGVLLHCVVCCLDRLANHVSVLLGIRETSCSPKCSCITISAPSRVLVSAFSAFLASLYSLETSS